MNEDGKIGEFFAYWFGPNWKTSIIGYGTFLLVCAYQAWNYFDGDPETKFDFSVILAALGIGGVARQTRDKHVSDQESGIPPERTSLQAYAKYQEKHGTGDGSITGDSNTGDSPYA